MKEYWFPYVFEFGEWDKENGEIEIKLSDEESIRLENAVKADPLVDFIKNTALSDIYSKVYDAIMDEEKDLIFADRANDENNLLHFDDDDYDPEPITLEQLERYSNEVHVIIYYPEELGK